MLSFIHLRQQDNVVIASRYLNEGEAILFKGEPIQLLSCIRSGHKIAVKDIPAKGKVLKYDRQ